MLFQAISLAFVIFTSLVGTFFVAITLFELFLSDDKKDRLIITITQQNQDQAEYILRSALVKTDKTIEVLFETASDEPRRIVELLTSETSRIIIPS